MSGLVQINFFVDGRELVKCTLLHSREHWIPRHEVVTVSSRLLVPRRTDQFRVLRHATSQRRARDLHGRSSRYYDAPLPEVGGGGTWKATPPPGSPRRSASNAAKRTKQRTGIDQKERLGKLRGIEKGGLCTGWWPQPQILRYTVRSLYKSYRPWSLTLSEADTAHRCHNYNPGAAHAALAAAAPARHHGDHRTPLRRTPDCCKTPAHPEDGVRPAGLVGEPGDGDGPRLDDAACRLVVREDDHRALQVARLQGVEDAVLDPLHEYGGFGRGLVVLAPKGHDGEAIDCEGRVRALWRRRARAARGPGQCVDGRALLAVLGRERRGREEATAVGELREVETDEVADQRDRLALGDLLLGLPGETATQGGERVGSGRSRAFGSWWPTRARVRACATHAASRERARRRPRPTAGASARAGVPRPASRREEMRQGGRSGAAAVGASEVQGVYNSPG
eukprot:gene10771-biopygen5129